MSRVIKIYSNKANYNSFKKRDVRDIKAIVVHYTGIDNDTAENEGNYFKNNVVKASAHYFIDRNGIIVKSVPYTNVAWSVETPGMKLKGFLNNSNTVSIELCNFKKYKTISKKQKESLIWLIKYLRKRMPNCTQLVRHYDICGKIGPANLIDEAKWNKFKTEVWK